MKFGTFYELQLPRPWGADDERQLYQNALTQVELADRLGYNYAWEVEHHFLEEYSHSPQPEVFLAAASQRTKNIRLGHGIIQLTTNHPAPVAEKVACLDLVSNGRVEFGMGEGASITELGPFDRKMEDSRQSGKTPYAAYCQCSRMRAGSMTARISSFHYATCCPSRCKNHIRRSGSRAHSSKQSSWPGVAVSEL